MVWYFVLAWFICLFFGSFYYIFTSKNNFHWYWNTHEYGERYIGRFKIEKHFIKDYNYEQIKDNFRISISNPDSHPHWIVIFKDGKWVHKGPWVKEFENITSRLERNELINDISKKITEQELLKQEKKVLIKLYKEK